MDYKNNQRMPFPVQMNSLTQYVTTNENKEEEDTIEDQTETIFNDPMTKQLQINSSQSHRVQDMNQNSGVYTYLYRGQRFAKHPSWVGTKPSSQWTHNLMNTNYGGGFALDNTDKTEKEFLYWYTSDLALKHIHYIIEKRTKFFKFHADLDIKRKEPMDDETIITLICDLIDCVKKFYPSTTAISRFDVMICLSRNPGKTGIHPIFPNLIVNENQAIDIRNYYVSYLTSKYGDMVGLQNSWEEIVDMSVYQANGLRMVGSHKTEPCKDCKISGAKKRKHSNMSSPKKHTKCEYCGGRGRTDSGKVYMPFVYIRNSQVHKLWTEKIQNIVNQINDGGVRRSVVELCSIRCPTINEASSDFAITDEETMSLAQGKRKHNKDSTEEEEEGSEKKRLHSPRERIYKEMKTDVGTYRITEEDFRGMSKYKQKQFLEPRSESFQMVQEYIQSKGFPSVWRKLNVHDIFTNPKKTHYIVNVRGDGQHFCLNNRKGSHRSNSIYFFIEQGAMYQRCYCSCQTIENRKNGQCDSFSSEPIPLPMKLDRILFPVIQGKLGHLHGERNVALSLDFDEYTMKLASTIAKIDDALKDYLEDRKLRFNNRREADEIKPTDEVQLTLKRRRKNPKKKNVK